MDLTDIFRIFHPKTEEYTFFSVHMDHSPGQTISWVTKTSLSKFKKIEIISSIFYNHNTMRLDINYKEKNVRNTNRWRLKSMFLNNNRLLKKSKGKSKKFLEANDNANTTSQNLWDAVKALLRGNFIAIQFYLMKQEKHWRDNLTLHLKQLEK